LTKELKAMIKWRSAIEPAIRHMKADGKLNRNWLKGRLGDAIHTILCGTVTTSACCCADCGFTAP